MFIKECVFFVSIFLISVCKASNPATLTIHGDILPNSCNLNISDSDINIGMISIRSLPRPSYGAYQLKDIGKGRDVNFSIVCDAKIPTALSFLATTSPIQGLNILNDHGQIVNDVKYQSSLGEIYKGGTIGAYLMSVRNASSIMVDGREAGTLLTSSDRGISWKTQSELIIPQDNKTFLSWAFAGTGYPQPAERISGRLHLLIALSSLISSTLTDETRLDGSTTVTLVYL